MKNMVVMISLFLIIALAILASGSSARQEPLLVQGSLTAVSSGEEMVPAEAAGLPGADSEPCGLLESTEALPVEEDTATGTSEGDRAGEGNSNVEEQGIDSAAGGAPEARGEETPEPGSSGETRGAADGEGSSPGIEMAADEPE
ncbi:MAG: hypothetical protein GX878_01375 [Firmicutes bacterium]|nr:hypothetical protein [Bacillota bacterium]